MNGPENEMPYQDFRQFLDVLRQQGELIDVDRPIALTDVGKALKQAYQKGRPDPAAHVGVYDYVALKEYIESLFAGRVDVVSRDALKLYVPPLRMTIEQEIAHLG
jgi:hypothetical protein